jgi:hypothetical protein
LVEFENFQKPGLEGYNKFQQPPTQWFIGQGKDVVFHGFIIETNFASSQWV